MAASAEKSRPANVPEENVYDKTHWLLIVTYLMAAIAVFLLISNAGMALFALGLGMGLPLIIIVILQIF